MHKTPEETPSQHVVETSVDDPHLLGLAEYLIKTEKLNLSIVYRMGWSGRVSGHVTGDAGSFQRISDALENDEPIPCRSLIDSIRAVRTRIFKTKALHQSDPKGGA